jgi:hypothetical protein
MKGAVPAGVAQCTPRRGGRVGPVVPNPGALAVEAALVLELGFPLNLGLELVEDGFPGCLPLVWIRSIGLRTVISGSLLDSWHQC